MSNHFIIDGWNVCWKIPELAEYIPSDLEKVRIRFNQIVAGYFAGKKVSYKIVYDGQTMIFPDTKAGENRICFSKNPEKADDLILRVIRKQRNRKNWTVVTSDIQLALEARDLGARSILSEEFIYSLNKNRNPASKVKGKTTPGIAPEDIDYWLGKFSGNGEGDE